MGNLLLVMIVVALAIIYKPVYADPDNLQDLCVADLGSALSLVDSPIARVPLQTLQFIQRGLNEELHLLEQFSRSSGSTWKHPEAISMLISFGSEVEHRFPCKPIAMASDFFFAGLSTPGITFNQMRSKVTTANVNQIPGPNTLGVSLARIDFAPDGLNHPHTHPRATEVIFVLYGQLDVGFITTANILISQTIKTGEIFTFPKGLVHFQKNNGLLPAAVLSALNSQLPGTQAIAATLFTSAPKVPDDVLAQNFQINPQQVMDIKTRLTPRV